MVARSRTAKDTRRASRNGERVARVPIEDGNTLPATQRSSRSAAARTRDAHALDQHRVVFNARPDHRQGQAHRGAAAGKRPSQVGFEAGRFRVASQGDRSIFEGRRGSTTAQRSAEVARAACSFSDETVKDASFPMARMSARVESDPELARSSSSATRSGRCRARVSTRDHPRPTHGGSARGRSSAARTLLYDPQTGAIAGRIVHGLQQAASG